MVCEKAAALQIAIVQAGIAARTLALVQGFERKKRMRHDFPFPPTFPTRISNDHEICLTHLEIIEPEREDCQAHALITTSSPPHRDRVKVPYLNQMNEKKAIERYA